jgi:DNA-binding NarL/FixJ family response regulator
MTTWSEETNPTPQRLREIKVLLDLGYSKHAIADKLNFSETLVTRACWMIRHPEEVLSSP